MDTESLSSKEKVIRAVEVQTRVHTAVAWIFLGGAVVLVAFGVSTWEMHHASNPVRWVQLIVELPPALFMLGISLIAWQFAAHRQRLLAQLKEILAQETAGEQPGVWPPPPSEPGE